MDWARGYAVLAWRLYEVDPDTWADAGELPRVTSATVERDLGGSEDAPLVESGTISLTAPVGGQWSERYVRLAMIADQGAGPERTDVATLRASSKGGTIARGADALTLDCRSVLWPASVLRLEPGSHCPAGTDGCAWAADLLASCLSAPVSHVGSFEVSTDYVFDLGETPLGAAWTVLRAGGYTISIDGRGRVMVGPRETEPALLLDRAGARLLAPEVSHDLDLSGVPNRHRAVDDLLEAEAVNDDPLSEVSTVVRGYYHDGDGIDDSPIRVDGESLAQYCARMLEEESVVLDTRSYVRKFWPGVRPGSLVRATLPDWGLEGDLRVQRQTVSCGAGVTVTEEAAREVALWVRS